jgi:hypothetical protein
MNAYLGSAGAIAVLLGMAHSYFGEKYLITPILRGDKLLSGLSGNVGLKKVALRVAWHFASIALWSSGIVLLFLSSLPIDHTSMVVARVISLTYVAYTLLVFVTPGLRLSYLARHLAWLAFVVIAALSWWGSLR